jgi:hypothetical protein
MNDLTPGLRADREILRIGAVALHSLWHKPTKTRLTNYLVTVATSTGDVRLGLLSADEGLYQGLITFLERWLQSHQRHTERIHSSAPQETVLLIAHALELTRSQTENEPGTTGLLFALVRNVSLPLGDTASIHFDGLQAIDTLRLHLAPAAGEVVVCNVGAPPNRRFSRGYYSVHRSTERSPRVSMRLELPRRWERMRYLCLAYTTSTTDDLNILLVPTMSALATAMALEWNSSIAQDQPKRAHRALLTEQLQWRIRALLTPPVDWPASWPPRVRLEMERASTEPVNRRVARMADLSHFLTPASSDYPDKDALFLDWLDLDERLWAVQNDLDISQRMTTAMPMALRAIRDLEANASHIATERRLRSLPLHLRAILTSAGLDCRIPEQSRAQRLPDLLIDHQLHGTVVPVVSIDCARKWSDGSGLLPGELRSTVQARYLVIVEPRLSQEDRLRIRRRGFRLVVPGVRSRPGAIGAPVGQLTLTEMVNDLRVAFASDRE